MSISPWPSGATDPPFNVSGVNDAGNAVPLNGATMTVIIRNTQTLQDRIGAGSWSGGNAFYTPDPLDSALPGNTPVKFEVFFQYVIGSRKGISDPIPWVVTPV